MDIPEEFQRNNFVELEQKIPGGIQKYYLVSKEGFSLVVMGFTGKKATLWKVNFIEDEEWVRSSKKGSETGSSYEKTRPKSSDHQNIHIISLKLFSPIFLKSGDSGDTPDNPLPDKRLTVPVTGDTAGVSGDIRVKSGARGGFCRKILEEIFF